MKTAQKQKWMIAAVAGLMTVAGAAVFQAAAQAQDVQCYGVNKCKGTGDCGGKGHSCAGINTCKGQGWVTMDKSTCMKMNGGSLTPKT